MLVVRARATKPLEGQKDLPTDVDIKFQIHLCLIKLKNSQEALQVLQSIPGKQRTPKVNMALAKMFQEQGMERSAITTYKEVLRECPLALEAAEGLLSLGVKGIEVNSLIVGCASNLSNLDWLNTWIKAHAHIHNREYTHAVSTLRSLDNVNLLRDNFNLLTIMGECYYYAGDDKNALLCLRRARIIEPDVMKGVDVYAAVLYKTHSIKELERLIPIITASNECTGEIYVAMAYSLYASRKLGRANTLTAQALNLNPSVAQDGAISGGEKRDYVIQELVETERNYSDVLNSLLKYFARPLSSLLRPEDSTRIFFGIKELAEIHAGFHSQLRKARTGAALAQVFLDWREKFLIYGDYCANLTLAQNTLQEACARNELVNQEVIRCQQEANNGKFKLRDILSVPMQRVLKYHLLLDKLVEETPCDWLEDRRQLTKAREVMVDIAQYINEVKRDSDTLDIIRDIQASIIDWDVPEDTQLKDFGRLLRDGELKVKAHGDQRLKARYVFVFEQVVLICKAGRGEQYCYRETLRLDDYRLEDHTGRRTLGRDSRWSYQWLLVHKQEYTAYTLHARTEEQKQMWMKALQDAMDNVNPAACRNTNHKFKLTTFNTPRSCQRCGKFLKGRIFQGYRCEACCYAVHKQCIAHSGRCMPIPPPPPPPPSLSCERALSVKLWFVGEMGRDTASNKLEPREDGTYMLRVRPAGQPRLKHETNYALSIKADGAVKHIRVFKRDVDGADVYYLSESRFFKSVVELVEYYERASLSENFEKLDQRLLWPYRRVLAKALFDFRGGERNQLNLRRGCRVVVLSKEGDAKGWWKGKIGDQVGFFPKEYVEEE